MKNLLKRIAGFFSGRKRNTAPSELAEAMNNVVQPFKRQATWIGTQQEPAGHHWDAVEETMIPELINEADQILQPMVDGLVQMNEEATGEHDVLQMEIDLAEREKSRSEHSNAELKDAARTSFETQSQLIQVEKDSARQQYAEAETTWKGAQMLHSRSRPDNLTPPVFGHISPLAVNAFDFTLLRNAFEVAGLGPAGQTIAALSICSLLAFFCVLVAKVLIKAKTNGKGPAAAIALTLMVLVLLLFTGIFRATGMDAMQHVEDVSYSPMSVAAALANGNTWTFFSLSATCFILGVVIVRLSSDSNMDFISAFRTHRSAKAIYVRSIRELDRREHSLRVAYTKHQQQLNDTGTQVKTGRELLHRINAYNRMIAQMEQAYTRTQRLIAMANSQFSGYVRECRSLAGVSQLLRPIPKINYQLPTITIAKFSI